MSFKDCCAIAVLASAIMLSSCAAHGQTQNAPRSEVAGIPVNYNEALVGTYTLPDLLLLANGQPVRDAKTWYQKRRPEIVRLFEENQFGRSLGRPAGMSFDVFDKGTPALDGKAIRRQVTVYFSRDKAGPKMDLLIYLPANARKPAAAAAESEFHRQLECGGRFRRQTRRSLGPRQEEDSRAERQFRQAQRRAPPGPGHRCGHGLLR